MLANVYDIKPALVWRLVFAGFRDTDSLMDPVVSGWFRLVLGKAPALPGL